MARIITRSNGLREIRFSDKNRKTRSMHCGRMPKREAEAVASKIDHLISRQITGNEPDVLVSQWLADLPEKLHAKFVRCGLTEPRAKAELYSMPTIASWTDQYIASLNTKPSNIEQLVICARSLIRYFGADRQLDQVTVGDAADFRRWLEREGNERKKFTCGLAMNTVRRRLGRCKQLFNAAVDHRFISESPFRKENSAVTGNPDRYVEVPALWIEKMIRATDCEDWKIILAFARYAGMRSHETRIQRWDHIDLMDRTMIVRSYKNHQVGVDVVYRKCPIFPELFPHLMRAKEMAPEGAEWVQTRYSHDANIGTEFARLAVRSGLVPWEKPMQNLRATRETELCASYPDTDVCSWLGNTPGVAQKHYLMPQQASFQRAIKEGAKLSGFLDGVFVENPHQNPHQPVPVSGGQGKSAQKKTPQNTGSDLRSTLLALADYLESCPTRT